LLQLTTPKAGGPPTHDPYGEQAPVFDEKKAETMRTITSTIATVVAVSGAAIGFAGAAAAAPGGPASVTETVNQLRSQGFNVQLNGTRGGPLTNCSIDGLRQTSEKPGSTVYVDLSCPFEYEY